MLLIGYFNICYVLNILCKRRHQQDSLMGHLLSAHRANEMVDLLKR